MLSNLFAVPWDVYILMTCALVVVAQNADWL